VATIRTFHQPEANSLLAALLNWNQATLLNEEATEEHQLASNLPHSNLPFALTIQCAASLNHLLPLIDIEAKLTRLRIDCQIATLSLEIIGFTAIH
jgi:hypothetical protein